MRSGNKYRRIYSATLRTFPASLFAGNVSGGWYDPSDITTLFQDTSGQTPVTAAGQSVLRINDKSGNGNHLIQATSTFAPTYQTTTFPHLLFDGTNDRMSTSVGISILSAAGGSSMAAVRITQTGSVECVLDADASSASNRLAQLLRGNSGATETLAFNTTPTAFTDQSGQTFTASEDFVMAGTITPTTVENWKNQTSNGTTAFTGTFKTTSEQLYMGARNRGANDFLNGRVYQALHIARPLSAAEQSQLATFFGAKIGLTL